MDNLCHIREFVPFWTGETVRIVQRPGEQWGRNHTDTARLAAVTGTAANTLEDVVADIRRLVRQSVNTLSDLSDNGVSAEATSKNPRFGAQTGILRRESASCLPRREAPRPDSTKRHAIR